LKVLLFTVIGTLAAVLVFGSIIVLPYIWELVEKITGATTQALWLHDGIRFALAFVVLTLAYCAMYGWLPDTHQRFRTVVPGALAGALMWLGAAAILSYTLRSVGKLAMVYGGFTGLVATLVFLYASAVTLIFGAEINAALRDSDADSPTAKAVEQ
jgi:membrane protein